MLLVWSLQMLTETSAAMHLSRASCHHCNSVCLSIASNNIATTAVTAVTFAVVQDAAKGVNLRTTLHLAYLLTPLSPPSGLRPNWEWLRSVSESDQSTTVEAPHDIVVTELSIGPGIGLSYDHLPHLLGP